MADQFDEIDADALDDAQETGAMRMVSIIIVVMAVVGFFTLAWYAYNAGVEGEGVDSVDVIRADNTPTKEAPAEPGGQQFPHQDKAVYNLVSGAPEPKVAEQILPSPEEPVKRPQTETWMNKKLYPDRQEDKAPDAEEAKPDDAAGEAMAVDKPTPPAENFKPKAPAKKEPAPKKIAKPQDAVEPVLPRKETKGTVLSTQKTPPRRKSSGGAVVQLGAYKSESEANGQWSKIRSRNQKIIADKEPDVVRADLGAKGIFYRLRIGGFTNPKEARSFCDALSENGQACMPVTEK